MEKESEKKNNSTKFPIIILIIIFFIFAVTLFSGTKELKSIPTCLYGCDYYYENGEILDVRNEPGDFALSSHDWLGITSSLPKASFYIKALTAEVFGLGILDNWKATIILSFIFLFATAFAWYFFFTRIFNNKWLCIALTIVSSNLYLFPLFKYHSIITLFLPLLLNLLMEIFKHENNLKKDIILTIITLMVFVYTAHIHAMTFFMVYILIILGYITIILKTLKPKEILKKLKDKIFLRKTLLLAFIAIMGFVICILLKWWRDVLFVYGNNGNAIRYDIHINLAIPSNYFSELFFDIKTLFFSYTNAVDVILSILTLIGFLLFLITYKKLRWKKKEYVLWITLFIIVSIFSYVVTAPLLGKHLSPKHALTFTKFLFKAIFVGFLVQMLPAIGGLKITKKHITFVSIILICIFSTGTVVSWNKYFKTDKWWQNGKYDIPPHYSSLVRWIETTNQDTSKMIILSTNELSFALHSLTGCKLLVGRQSHFFMFGEFQDYWMDAAVLFYGNDTSNKLRILDKYSKRAKSEDKELYLYWDIYWLESEWQKSGENLYPFDPLRFEYNEEREDILRKNGIKYIIKENAVFEPSAQNNPHATRLTIMYVSPENYYNTTHPWKPDIDEYLEEIWHYEKNGQIIARLYKIKR